jgi:hypothetical protein
MAPKGEGAYSKGNDTAARRIAAVSLKGIKRLRVANPKTAVKTNGYGTPKSGRDKGGLNHAVLLWRVGHIGERRAATSPSIVCLRPEIGDQ